MEKLPQNECFQVLHFTTQKVHLCQKLNTVQRIFPLMELEIIPNSPDYVAGLLNLAGEGIFIIDLSLRLGLHRKKSYTINTPIILCQMDSQHIGMIVDNVIGIDEIENTQLQMEDEFSKTDSPFLAAVVFNHQLSLLLNLNNILNMDLTLNTNLNIHSKLIAEKKAYE